MLNFIPSCYYFISIIWVQFLGWKDPLKEGMEPTPVFLPGESPWAEESGGLQSRGSQKIRHDWATKHSTV